MKLKANSASVTEEKKKERLRKRLEKNSAKGEPKETEGKKMSEKEDHYQLRLVTVKILKCGGENEVDRKLRLEEVVASKHLR